MIMSFIEDLVSKIFSRDIRFLFIAFILIGSLSSCISSKYSDIERGNLFQFVPGLPEFRTASIGLLNERDEAYINITTNVVYESLIYKSENNYSLAVFSSEIRINAKNNSFSKVFNEVYELNIEELKNSDKNRFHTIIQNFDVKPGTYLIEQTITDMVSGKSFTITDSANIPDPHQSGKNLTTIKLSAKNVNSISPEYIPVTSYNIPSRNDSLRFEFQITNNDTTQQPLTVQSRLLRFEADSSAAIPIHFTNYSPSSIENRGIFLRNPSKILDTSVRKLDQKGSIFMEFNYSTPIWGNYRFEVQITNGRDETDEILYGARDFSIKTENYPEIISVREMAEPLHYIMKNSEFRKLMSISDPDSLKEAIDRFWLSNIQDESIARSTINLYYERVEEANKQFSSFKEGWKTDTGKVYILFGPPLYIQKAPNRMRWFYTHQREDSSYTFSFERDKSPNKAFPFSHYVLDRNSRQYGIQHRQKQLWRSGKILTIRI
jgi:GWxTD domain-containing protein